MARRRRNARDDTTPWARAVTRADPQGGAISYPQLRDAGMSSSAITRRITRGDLHPKHDGVHALGRPALTAYGAAWAAQLAVGSRGALALWSASAGLKLTPWPLRPQIIVVGGAIELDGVDVRRTRSLPDDEIWVHRDGLRFTAWPRMVTDLAARSSIDQIQTVLDLLERRDLLDLESLDRAIQRARGRKGLRKLKTALEPYTTIPEAEYLSLLERFSGMVLQAAGLGDHEPNGTVKLGNGRTIRVDILFREAGLAVEVDGRDTHDRSRQFETDRERDRELQKLGYIVLRFSWRDVMYRPDAVVRDIVACLEHRRVA
jgi:hypothetical protein